MASTEKSIENEIKTYLETRRLQGDKVFFYKQFQSGATMQGLPDIIASSLKWIDTQKRGKICPK